MNLKKIFLIIAALSLTLFFTSCGEQGGIIEVENKYSENIEVNVCTRYEHNSTNNTVIATNNENKTVFAGRKEKFEVTSNSTYYVWWKTGPRDNPLYICRSVSVSDGKTVSISIGP